MQVVLLLQMIHALQCSWYIYIHTFLLCISWKMTKMLMPNTIPPLTLSASCKCYHIKSLHRHPIPIHLTRGNISTARWVRERRNVIYLTTRPPWVTPWKLLDLFGSHLLKNVQDYQCLTALYFIRHVQYDIVLIKRDTRRLLHKSFSPTFSCLV